MRRIVERTIKGLKAPTSGHEIVWDGEVPGFGVRVTSNGVIAFVLSYRAAGRKHRYTLGRYPELSAQAAREKAIQLRGRILDGGDPLKERRSSREEPTLNDLADEYLEKYAAVHKREYGVANDRRMLKAVIRPRLGSHRLKAISRRDIEALKAEYQATPYEANRALALLSKMFNLAREWGWYADENPCKGVERYPEQPRERWLTVDELNRLNKALDAETDQNAANAIRLLMMTGARKSEWLRAEWSEIDFERGTWTKPSHHTKTARVERAPLSKPALELLKKMRRKGASGPIFPDVSLRLPWARVCKAAKLGQQVTIKGKKRDIVRWKPTIRLHDLRHSFASHLVSQGMSLQIVGKLLGHTNPSTTNRYAHVADAALRDAANQFSQILRRK